MNHVTHLRANKKNQQRNSAEVRWVVSSGRVGPFLYAGARRPRRVVPLRVGLGRIPLHGHTTKVWNIWTERLRNSNIVLLT